MKKWARIWLAVVVLMAAMLACGGGGGGGTGGGVSSDNVTATYGAEEFHAQLTALAR